MKKIYLTQKEFDNLLEYSFSLPTGTTIGKRWKSKYERGWYMGEYALHSDPKLVKINWYEIVIAGHLEVDKIIAKFNERL